MKNFRLERLLIAPLCATALVLAASKASSAEVTLDSVGARAGFGANDTGNGMHEEEIFANWRLPWRWGAEDAWRVQSRLQGSIGNLGGAGDEAFIATVGPNLLLSLSNFPVSFEGGSSPTVLTRDTFGERKNIGSLFQFTTYAGLNYDIGSHWRVGYRFQHMSNAGISRPNPGLNMHIFGFSFLF